MSKSARLCSKCFSTADKRNRLRLTMMGRPVSGQSAKIAGLTTLIIFATAFTARADSGTWKAAPSSNLWSDPGAWTSGAYPDGQTDIATFNTSNIVNLLLFKGADVGAIVFNSNANAFVITLSDPPLGIDSNAELAIDGAGITNNSGKLQKLVTNPLVHGAQLDFNGSATAGVNTSITNMAVSGSNQLNGATVFHNTATAGSTAISNTGERER